MKNIQVLDRSFKRLAFIDNSIENGIHFIDDNLSTSIETGLYTLDMEIPKDTYQVKYVTEGNYITFLNRHNVRILLTIMKVTENRDSIFIFCEDTSINLINKIVEDFPMPSTAKGIEYYLNLGLKDTGWSIGTNDSTTTRKLEFTGDETLLSRIRKIAEEFGVEFYFEVNFEYNEYPDFLMHIVKKRIEDEPGFRVSSDDALDIIEREVNLDNIVTRMIVKGAEASTSTVGESEVNKKGDDTANKISQELATKYDSSKSSSAGPISTTNWNEAWVDKFRMDSVDPPYVTGAYIDQFLRSRYSDSPLIGHGNTIKEMADYFGISVGAAIGVWAKETTFGRGHPGKVDYNFGCIRWTSGSGFPAVTYAGSKWNKYPNIKTGIAAWFKLLRYNYIDKGYRTYKSFLDRYSPSFENNQSTFKNLMWGSLKSFGYDTSETKVKKNYSSINDNPISLDLSSKNSTNTTNNKVTTKHNEMIEQMIKWFQDRKGKVTYSMNSRSGPNSYDCSSAVYSALKYAGFKTKINWLGSTVSLWEDVGSSNLMVEIPVSQAKRGDIFLSGAKGAASAGASGHTGVFLSSNQIIHCNYRDNGISVTGLNRSGTPLYAFRLNDKTSGSTTILDDSSKTDISSKIEQAVQICLQQVGKPYVYGGNGPNSFDCSGLIYYAYNKAGVPINHRCTTRTIANQQTPFKKISAAEARRGDLVLCVNGSHVAVLLGTPSSGAGVVHAATPQLGVITQKSLMGPIGYYRVT